MSKEQLPPDRPLIGSDSITGPGGHGAIGGTSTVRNDHETIEVHPILRTSENWSFGDWVSLLVRRKTTVLLVALLVFLASGVITALMTPTYQSKAVLEIEKDSGSSLSNLGDMITQGMGMADPEVFATQIEILKGRAMVEALIGSMRLDEKSDKEPGIVSRLRQAAKKRLTAVFPSLEETSKAISDQENLVKNVTDRISAKRGGKSRLIEVSVDAESPQMAQQMLRAHIDNFLLQNLEKRRRIQKDGAEWANNEMARVESKVLESLTNLVSFTTEHGVLSIDESTNHLLSFFQKAAENVMKTSEQRIQVEALQKDGDARASAVTNFRSPDLEQMYGKVALMESEYAQMKELYSENSPKLVLLKKQLEFLKNRISEQQSQTVSSALQAARQQEQISQDEFQKAKQKALDNSSLNVRYAVLKKEAETNQEIYRTLLQKSKELMLATQIIGNNILEIVQPSLPARAVKPRVGLNLLIGCFLGLVSGVLAAFIKENFDKSVHDSRELGHIRLVNLGMVPNYRQLPKFHSQKSTELAIRDDPRSPLAEAFSLIKTSLFLSYSSEVYRVIMITSAVPSEGKSFCSLSLASSVAKSGKKVLLIEGDMRKPRLSQLLGISSNGKGLSAALVAPQVRSYRDFVRKTSFDGLYFLGAGSIPKDSARLLESGGMIRIIQWARNIFDTILIDSPPVAGFADARILASLSDGIIFVVKQGHASLDMIQDAVAALSSPSCGRILGTIFNNVGVSRSRVGSYFGYGYTTNSYYYKYRYSDYYDHKSSAGKKT